MNTSHYPSLELCKKLTEIGFQGTELGIFDTRKSWKNYNCPYVNEYGEPKFVPFWNIEIGNGELEIAPFGDNPSAGYNDSLPLVCPSVMEMLDEMPYVLDIGEHHTVLTIKKVSELNFNICYTYKHFEIGNFNGPLQNALAEMILWLHENKYITF